MSCSSGGSSGSRSRDTPDLPAVRSKTLPRSSSKERKTKHQPQTVTQQQLQNVQKPLLSSCGTLGRPGVSLGVLSLDQEVGVSNTVLLEPLTEDAFIANLYQRFKRDQIYVSDFKQIMNRIILYFFDLHSTQNF
jgi:hypothetical protein